MPAEMSPIAAFKGIAMAACAGFLAGCSDADNFQCTKESASLYVMGYGSLMKEASRMKTSCNITSLTASQIEGVFSMVGLENLDPEVEKCVRLTGSQKMMPVLIQGARRGWYSQGKLANEGIDDSWPVQGLDLAPTYLGAVADADSEMYAVIYPVTQKQFEATDAREESGTYTPSWINTSLVQMLNPNDKLDECSMIRWYPQDPSQVTVPTEAKPICESYVDLFLSGVMDLGKANGLNDYVANVLQTTYGWSNFWVNDREVVYRPFAQEKDAFAVTKALGASARAGGVPQTSSVDLPAGSLNTLSFDIMMNIKFPTKRNMPGQAPKVAPMPAMPTVAPLPTLPPLPTVPLATLPPLPNMPAAPTLPSLPTMAPLPGMVTPAPLTPKDQPVATQAQEVAKESTAAAAAPQEQVAAPAPEEGTVQVATPGTVQVPAPAPEEGTVATPVAQEKTVQEQKKFRIPSGSGSGEQATDDHGVPRQAPLMIVAVAVGGLATIAISRRRAVNPDDAARGLIMEGE